MEPPTWITCIFNCAPITYFDNPITGFVDRINTAQIVNKKLSANLAGESYCHCRVYQRKTVRCGVFICSVAAIRQNTLLNSQHAGREAACRKRSKPLLKFPLIKAGASLYCQRPFRHQIEVLNNTKHQKKFRYNISEILSSVMLFNG